METQKPRPLTRAEIAFIKAAIEAGLDSRGMEEDIEIMPHWDDSYGPSMGFDVDYNYADAVMVIYRADTGGPEDKPFQEEMLLYYDTFGSFLCILSQIVVMVRFWRYLAMKGEEK